MRFARSARNIHDYQGQLRSLHGVQVGRELLLTARLAEGCRDPLPETDEWGLDQVVDELERSGKGCCRPHTSAACLSAREECQTAALLAAAQGAAIQGKSDVIAQLASEALRTSTDKQLVKALQQLSVQSPVSRNATPCQVPPLRSNNRSGSGKRQDKLSSPCVELCPAGQVDLPRFWHWKPRVTCQDVKNVRWRQHISNAHFIKWRLGVLERRRIQAAKQVKAAMVKDQAWHEREQHDQAHSAKAFARWLASKGTPGKLAAVKRPVTVSPERSLFQVCAADGVSDSELVAQMRSKTPSVVGRQAGSCFLQQLYQKYQQEMQWDPTPLSAIARKQFVFGGSEQASTGGIPAWQQVD